MEIDVCFELNPLSSCSMIIFFSLSGFFSKEGPNIKDITVSSGIPSTKDLLKSAGNSCAPFDRSHKTPPTIGSALDRCLVLT